MAGTSKSAQNHVQPVELEVEYDFVPGTITEEANTSVFSLVLLSLPVSGSCTSWMSVCIHKFMVAFPFASVPKLLLAKMQNAFSFILAQEEVLLLV